MTESPKGKKRKKQIEFQKLTSVKWIMLAVSLVLAIVFIRVVPTKSISDTAIVVGIAIEQTETGGYSVTCQMLVSTATGTNTSSDDSYAILNAESSTVGGALTLLGEQTGKLFSLAQCLCLIMDKAFFDGDPRPVVEGLTENWYLPKKAILIAADEEAKKVLSSKLPNTNDNSTFLSKLLEQQYPIGTLTRLNIKEFLADYYSLSACSTLPLLKIKPLGKDAYVGGSAGDVEYSSFDVQNNLVWSKNAKPIILDKIEAETFNYFTHKKNAGSINVMLSDGNTAVLQLKSYYSDIKYKKSAVDASFRITANITELYGENAPPVYLLEQSYVDYICNSASKQLEQQVKDLHQLSLEKDVDILQLQNGMFAFQGRTWKDKSFKDIAAFNVKFGMILFLT